jgi:hypothetical protein
MNVTPVPLSVSSFASRSDLILDRSGTGAKWNSRALALLFSFNPLIHDRLYFLIMNFTVTENGLPIANFLRREDAVEFLSNAQYENGYKLYELIRS